MPNFEITIKWNTADKEFSVTCPDDIVITLGMLEYAVLTQKQRQQVAMTVKKNIDVINQRIKEIESYDD